MRKGSEADVDDVGFVMSLLIFGTGFAAMVYNIYGIFSMMRPGGFP